MPLNDLALQLYSIRRETQADAEGTLRQVPAMGYNQVETAGDYGWSADKWVDLLHELDLKVVGAHLGINFLGDDQLESTLEFQKKVGNSRIILPHLAAEKTAKWYADYAKKLNDIAAKVHDAGFTFYYHNHAFEIETNLEGADGKCGLEIFMENTDSSLVSFEVDTYWVEKGGKNAADFIEMYIERIGMIHAKELLRATGADVPAGQGDVEFGRIIPLAIERGMPVVVEFEGENAIPAVTEAAGYLRSI